MRICVDKKILHLFKKIIYLFKSFKSTHLLNQINIMQLYIQFNMGRAVITQKFLVKIAKFHVLP